MCWAGYGFSTTFVRPTLWAEPFPASVALEPVLPEDSEGGVGFREVPLSDDQVAQLAARHGCTFNLLEDYVSGCHDAMLLRSAQGRMAAARPVHKRLMCRSMWRRRRRCCSGPTPRRAAGSLCAAASPACPSPLVSAGCKLFTLSQVAHLCSDLIQKAAASLSHVLPLIGIRFCEH